MDSQLFTTIALRHCSPTFVSPHRIKCRRRRQVPAEQQWPLGNQNLPEEDEMIESDVKRAVV